MVGMYVASQALGSGSATEEHMAIFEEALKQFAPRHGSQAIQLLPVIRAKESPHNEAYLQGWKDADLYMGHKLLQLASQRDSEAALERFFDRVRLLDSPTALRAESRVSEEYDMWVKMKNSTMDVMKGFFKDNDIFAMFTGAVFALHQDTLLKYSIDMLKTDDYALHAALDQVRPSQHGDFITRLRLVRNALLATDNANLDIVQKPDPRLSEFDQQARIFAAAMRSQAARIWLMTINSKVENTEAYSIRLGVMTMWMMLQVVPGETAAKHALNFTGDYYKDIRNENMNPSAWPQDLKQP
jgi:hypothetical protein